MNWIFLEMAWLVWVSSCQIEEHMWITTNPFFCSGECVVPALSWLCTNRSCHVWCVSFSRKWRRRSVCKEDGWRASRLRISMAVTWIKHPSEPLSWTLKWLWQGSGSARFSVEGMAAGCQKNLGHRITFLLLHFPSRPSVYRCGTCLQNPSKFGAVNTNRWSWSPCSGLALYWCTACPFFLFTSLELCLKSLLSFFFFFFYMVLQLFICSPLCCLYCGFCSLGKNPLWKYTAAVSCWNFVDWGTEKCRG